MAVLVVKLMFAKSYFSLFFFLQLFLLLKPTHLSALSFQSA